MKSKFGVVWSWNYITFRGDLKRQFHEEFGSKHTRNCNRLNDLTKFLVFASIANFNWRVAYSTTTIILHVHGLLAFSSRQFPNDEHIAFQYVSTPNNFISPRCSLNIYAGYSYSRYVYFPYSGLVRLG